MNPVKHVAIIMDGNGRWGLKKNKSRNFGHKKGLETVEKIIKETINQKITFLTLYAFSTENWKRPKKEINFLFSLLEDFLRKKTKYLHKNGIKFKTIGDKKFFSYKLKKILLNSEKITKNNKNLQINLALNYGSKKEIIDSFKNVIKKKQKINIKNIEENLYTSGMPNPDFIIRTGGKNRLSNFLLWQCAYSEIFFLNKLWPTFSTNDFDKMVNKFKKIKRNYGAI